MPERVPGTVDLAIVLPAYKGEFLARTLDAIASQSDRRFRVYVGDDGSPDHLSDIVSASAFSAEQLVYHRFDSNVGRTSLVRHWDRCIRLSHEPWVWLFSDDDIMEPDCVAAFYRTREQTHDAFDLYRFNTMMIDATDNVRKLSPPHPREESWRELAYFLLRNLRVCTQQEGIFRRRRYDEVGGFLDLPLAWGTDHAFTMACAGAGGLMTIDGPRVRFRQSGRNISSSARAEMRSGKVAASMMYVRWLMRYIVENPNGRERVPDHLIRSAALEWFERHLATQGVSIKPRETARLMRFMREVWDEPVSVGLLRLLRLHLEQAVAGLSGLARRAGVKGSQHWVWG